jgi:hypothetical protein
LCDDHAAWTAEVLSRSFTLHCAETSLWRIAGFMTEMAIVGFERLRNILSVVRGEGAPTNR